MPLLLTPHGHLLFDPTAVAVLEPRRVVRLQAAAALSSAEVLRWLATEAPGRALPAAGVFWRDFARRYFTALCHAPETTRPDLRTQRLRHPSRSHRRPHRSPGDGLAALLRHYHRGSPTARSMAGDQGGRCKHLSAVLYGVGARLDTRPELLFLLRGVDHLKLIGSAVESSALTGSASGDLADDQLADVFGIEIDAGAAPAVTNPVTGRTTSAKPITARTAPGTIATAAMVTPTKTAVSVKAIAAKTAAAKAPPPPAPKPSPKRSPKPEVPANGKRSASKAAAVKVKSPPPKAPVKRARKQA